MKKHKRDRITPPHNPMPLTSPWKASAFLDSVEKQLSEYANVSGKAWPPPRDVTFSLPQGTPHKTAVAMMRKVEKQFGGLMVLKKHDPLGVDLADVYTDLKILRDHIKKNDIDSAVIFAIYVGEMHERIRVRLLEKLPQYKRGARNEKFAALDAAANHARREMNIDSTDQIKADILISYLPQTLYKTMTQESWRNTVYKWRKHPFHASKG